ncbi:MFS transporter [Bradyrhizobium mercantei]|uniref:MFS transporter n=1 Tax=Bradyrhizobium mercantei TaxID=1904807 RepID=UPI000975B608|nr:MFS transporter [Bradyrhizobium mercantei]
MDPLDNQKPWRVILAATIGNALEWYDFIVYGFLAGTISSLFFPPNDPSMSLLLSTLSVGVAFVMRPLGGLVIGLYADRVGRKKALTLVIWMMFVSTALIAVAPTYATAGVAATVIVAIGRLLQGFSTGGEFGSATAFLIEYAPSNRRIFYGSWQMFAQASGALASTIMGAILFGLFSQSQIELGAWRIAFMVGLLIGPVGYYIRRRLHEPSGSAVGASAVERVTLWGTITGYPREIVVGLAVSAAVNVMSYVIITHLPLFVHLSLGLPQAVAFNTLLVAVTVRMMLIPVFGLLADRIDGITILRVALGTLTISVYPAYAWLIASPGYLSLTVVELWFAVLIAAAYAPAPTFLADLFPTYARATGLSIVYNVAATIFGGFSLFFVTLIGELTASKFAPAHYAVLFFMAALASLQLIPRPATTSSVASASAA